MAKKKKKELYNPPSRTKTKELLLKTSFVTTDTEGAIEKLRKEIFPAIKFETGEKNDKAWEDYQKYSTMVLSESENESRFNLISTFSDTLQPLIRKLTTDIEKEYNCTTSLEKSLVGTIVNAYARILDNSRRLNAELECNNITSNRNKYISNLSVQVDRANRQFLNSILALKQLKAPAVKMNIKADTAFVAQNQQVNQKENNESK